MPVDRTGQTPAYSTTAPAGSRENVAETSMRPADERRRTSALVSKSAELGHRMRRADARRVVLAYAEKFDQTADGWNAWLKHRLDPTQAAAFANLNDGGGAHG